MSPPSFYVKAARSGAAFALSKVQAPGPNDPRHFPDLGDRYADFWPERAAPGLDGPLVIMPREKAPRNPLSARFYWENLWKASKFQKFLQIVQNAVVILTNTIKIHLFNRMDKKSACNLDQTVI